MAPSTVDDRRISAVRKRVARLARLLDGSLRVPGTRFTIGLDSLLGLIPGVGDIGGALLGGSILLETLRVGAPRPLIVRMVGNLAIDGLLGAIPLAGDLFDFAFKSHARNAHLLLEHLDAHTAPAPPPRVTLGHRLLVALGLLLLIAIPLLSLYGLYQLVV